jgi:hypothetical protein
LWFRRQNNRIIMAGASDLASRLESEMLCPICLESYSDDEHVPKALPCQHTLCQVCLQRFIDAEDGGSFIKCPTCRENIRISPDGVGGFSNNLTVMSLLGYLKPGASVAQQDLSQLIKSKELVCIKHSIPATHVCCPCKQLLCYKCLGLIIKHQGHTKHQIVEVSDSPDLRHRIEIYRKMDHLKYLQKIVHKTKEATQRDIETTCKKGLEEVATRAEQIKTMVKMWEKEARSQVQQASEDLRSDITDMAAEADETIETLLANLGRVAEEGEYMECIHEQANSNKAAQELECTIQNIEMMKLSVELSDTSVRSLDFGQVCIEADKEPESAKLGVLSPFTRGLKYHLNLTITKLDTFIFRNIYDHQEVLGCVANGIPTVKSIVKNFHQKHQVVQEYALLFDKYHLMNETQMNDLSDNMSSLVSAYLVIKPNSDVIVQQHFSSKTNAKESTYRTYELRKKLPLNTLTQYPMRSMTGMLLAANNDTYLQKETVHHHHHHHPAQRGGGRDEQSSKWFYLSIVSAVNPCDCFLLRDVLGQEERFHSSSGILTCLAPDRNHVVVLDKTLQMIYVYDEKGGSLGHSISFQGLF